MRGHRILNPKGDCVMKRRASGILLHLTSLPTPFGIGDMGPEAYRFVDFLHETRQGFWQILPLNPTISHSDSPYQGSSAFAGNHLLISPELLVLEGLLLENEISSPPEFPSGFVDYIAVEAYKEVLLDRAYQRFCKKDDRRNFDAFCRSQSYWLEDYALFMAIKTRFPKKPWNEWPEAFRNRHADALCSIKEKMAGEMEMQKFRQFLFFEQWRALKAYCFQKGIQLIGDIPIYVHHDSTDVWSHQEIFKLDTAGVPYVVAGVPPDYFSETGQLWGNPVYRWDVLKERNYYWWVRRLEHNLTLTDIVRIDHFRGLVAYWEIPATEETAINGKWIEVPSLDFFSRLLKKFPYLPVIAEDLGTITPDVREMMHMFDLPGMKVLLFAFGDDLASNPYLPHNITRNSVIYTGTHDNNTVRGWFDKEASPDVKKWLFAYVGHKIPADQVHRELIRLAMMSVANLAVFPIQDILGLGQDARMNHPGGGKNNWKWRLLSDQLTPDIVEMLREITINYGRA